MKGKKLAAKIMLGLLLATPYSFVEANTIGEVSVDGVVLENVDANENFSFGNATSSTVEITKNNGYSIDLTDKTNGKIDGKNITLNGGVSYYSKTIECGTVTIGSDATDIVTIKGGVKDGISAVQGHVEVTADTINISTDAAGFGAVWVQNNTDITLAPDNAASVKLTANNINVTAPKLGLVAFSNGQLDINGNLTVEAEHAIDVRGNSTVNINQDPEGEYSTKLKGDIVFETNDEKGSGKLINANVNVNLAGEDSYWEGRAYQLYNKEEHVALEGDKVHGSVEGFKVEIKDGAQWNMTGNSFINNLALDDGGVVNMQNGATEFNATSIDMNDGVLNLNGDGQEVNVNGLTGTNGTVNVASKDNTVSIKESNDVESLTVAANGKYAEDLVKGNITEGLNSLAGQVVDNSDLGAGKTAATDVAIAETGVVGAITAQVGENGEVDAGSIRELTNQTTAGIGELANVAFMAWRAENDEMHQRMGELRSSTGEAGIWARMKRGESESGDLDITNQYNTYQLGYDEKVGDSNWYIGGAISRTEGKSSFANGSGENQSTGFTVYGTYVGDDGQYVDLSAKYARLDNEFDVFGRDGIESTGDYRNNGYAFSAEYGKRIEAGNDYWVEPQVQLTYGHLSSAEYTTSRNIKAAQDAMDSIVGRLGFAAGKDIGAGNVYVKASYLYDFDGDTNVTMNDGVNSRTYEQDLGGGWFEFGIGTNINLSETSHLYFDVEKAVGGEIDTPWQWNAGVRFDF